MQKIVCDKNTLFSFNMPTYYITAVDDDAVVMTTKNVSYQLVIQQLHISTENYFSSLQLQFCTNSPLCHTTQHKYTQLDTSDT